MLSNYEYDSLGYGRIKEYWWLAKEEPHEAIFSALKFIRESQAFRKQADLHHMRMYSNRLASGLSSGNYSLYDEGDRIKLNVVKSVVDTVLAKISTNRVKPMFLTEKGNFSMQVKAKNLGKFIMGQFYALDQYSVAMQVFLDACIFGTGFQLICEDPTIPGRLAIERVIPSEIDVDDTESKHGRPRQMFRTKEFSRDLAMAVWPDFADQIRESKNIEDDDVISDRSKADRVSVVEAWHLPSTPGAKDGRHVVCTSNATVVDEPWELPRFPVVPFRWSEPVVGFYGIGLVEELSSIQVEINYLLQKIQRLMTLATTNIWVHKGAGVAKSSINNMDMAIREYRGQIPQAIPQPAISPEYYAHLDRLYARAFEVAGVSQLAAQSQKPAGLNSGAALRTYHDIGSMRFGHIERRWEDFYLNVAELMIDVAREIEERGDGSIKVLAQNDKDIEEIKFSEVSIDKDKYTMKTWPTSLLPDTPSGKLETIKELAEVSPEIQQHILKLLDVPDLDGVRSLANAPVDLIDHHLERILEHGEYSPPLPFMDLEMARSRGTLALLRAEVDNAPEERVELLRRWLATVDELQKPPEQPMPGASMAEAGMPPMAGGPPMAPGGPVPPGLPPEGGALPPDMQNGAMLPS